MVAIELLAACQGLEFHRPKKTTKPLEEVYKLVRSVVKSWDKDRFMAPDIAAVTNLLQEGKVNTSTSLLYMSYHIIFRYGRLSLPILLPMKRLFQLIFKEINSKIPTESYHFIFQHR